jgi:hypothetical protein
MPSCRRGPYGKGWGLAGRTLWATIRRCCSLPGKSVTYGPFAVNEDTNDMSQPFPRLLGAVTIMVFSIGSIAWATGSPQ